jgi:hypothetical protein
MPVSLCLTWPAQRLIEGTTTDISIAGMRLVIDLELIVGERVRLDCAFCSAVGLVRSARLEPRRRREAWHVGIEFLTLRIKQPRGSLVSKDF